MLALLPAAGLQPRRLRLARLLARGLTLAALAAAVAVLRRLWLRQREQELKWADIIPEILREGRLANQKREQAQDKTEKKKSHGWGTEVRNCLTSAFEALRQGDCATTQGGHLLVSPKAGQECQLVAFAPQRFAHLRSVWGLSEDRFWASLCELAGGDTQCGGKSGSWFWFSADGLLVVKSVSKGELRTLLEGLARYMHHMASHRNSLLCRFFGAFELRLADRQVYLVVMNHIMAGSFAAHVVYDLKGTTEDRWVNPRPGVVLKDLNFADKIIGIADFRQKVELLTALKRDTRFLREQNVMDYSVCLGVHYCEGEAHPASEELHPEQGVASPLAIQRGFEPKFQCTLVRDQAARRVIYYIGIIDILQRYDMRKFVAHVVKSLSLGWLLEIDTAPPAYYARRFKTSFWGKVQTFREPGDRVARFVRRLQAWLLSYPGWILYALQSW